MPPKPKPEYTLADVIGVIDTSSLSRARRRYLTSSVRRVAKLIGKPPAYIPLDIPAIREALAKVNPVAEKIAVKTFQNNRWGFIDAVAESGLMPGVAAPRGQSEPLSPDWAAFVAALPNMRARNGTSRLVNYANRHTIAPSAVDDAVLQALMDNMAQTSLRANQPKLRRDIARIWNELVGRLPHLQLQRLTVPPSRRRYTRIPLSEFPKPFLADLDAYCDWCGGDRWADGAREQWMAESSIVTLRGQLHLAASLLVQSGTPIAAITSLSDLVAVESVRNILRARERSTGETSNWYSFHMSKSLLQVARDWVESDQDTLVQLSKLLKKLPEPKVKMTAKNLRRLDQFADSDNLYRLLELPDRLWREARQGQTRSNWTLVMAQAAIAIKLLLYIPIRLGNLTALTFGRHLILSSERGAISTLRIPAEETKNKVAVEFDVPEDLVRMLVEYRDRLAPAVTGRVPLRVFVKADGSSKSIAGVRYLIQAYCRRAGITLNPQLFRHLSGKLDLDEDPGAYEHVRQLLTHKSLATTTAYYVGEDTRRAGRHHQQLLERKLAKSRPRRRESGK